MEDTLEFFRSGGVVVSAAGRRRWPDDLKGQIVAETLEPEAAVRGVAERYWLHANRISEWRRLAKDGKLVLPAAEGPPGFAPLVLCDRADEVSPPQALPTTDMPVIGIAVGGVIIRLDAGTSSARTGEIVRAVG